MIPLPFRRAFLRSLLVASLLAPALAEAITVSESFDFNIPSEWTVKDDKKNLQGASRGVQRWGKPGAPEKGLLLQRDTLGQHRANVVYFEPAEDVRGSVLLQVNGSYSLAGVLLRSDNTSQFNTTGYFLGIRDAKSVFIAKNPAKLHIAPGEILVETPLAGVQGFPTFKLEFEAKGEQLRVTVLAWHAPGKSWKSVGSAEARDATHTGGYFGLRATFGAEPRTAQFANFELASIEP